MERESCYIFKRSARALSLSLFFIIGFGCGPELKTKSTAGNPSALAASSLAAQASSGGNGTWACPNVGSYNLMPVSGITSDVGSFQVCRAKSDPARLRISGINSSRAICIYPAFRNANLSSIQLTEARQCYEVGTAPIIVTIQDSRANYLYIVDGQYSYSMDRCFGTSTGCPSFSKGSIDLVDLPFSP